MSDRGAGPRAVGRSLSPGRSQGGPHGPGPPRAPLSWAVALPRGLARSAHSLLPAPTSALIQVNVRCAPPRAGAARCSPGRRVWDPRARLSCGRGDPAPRGARRRPGCSSRRGTCVFPFPKSWGGTTPEAIGARRGRVTGRAPSHTPSCFRCPPLPPLPAYTARTLKSGPLPVEL